MLDVRHSTVGATSVASNCGQTGALIFDKNSVGGLAHVAGHVLYNVPKAIFFGISSEEF